MADEQVGQEIEVRAALPADREVLNDLGYGTAEGGRVVGNEFDRWLSDYQGRLMVATHGAEIVGMVRVSLVAEGEGWIEGLSVAPALQRQGIGRVLLSRGLVAARELGAQVARAMASTENSASQGLLARFGFTTVAEVTRYLGLGHHDAAPSILTIPGTQDLDRLWEWLVQSTLTPLNGGLEMIGWRARALGEEALVEALAAGNVVTVEEWGVIQALAVLPPSPSLSKAAMQVRYIDGLADGVGRLALALRAVVGSRNYASVALWLPSLLILRDAMDGAGCTPASAPMAILARDL